MDENLQNIFRVQPLLENVMTYRTDSRIRKLIKQTCADEIKNLLNVELSITQVELKLPGPDEIPPITTQEIKQPTELNDLLADYDSTMEALKCIN